jgi:hypothetical protein
MAAWTTVPPVCEECAPAIPIDLATSNQFGEIVVEQFRDYQHLPLFIDASVIEGGNIGFLQHKRRSETHSKFSIRVK